VCISWTDKGLNTINMHGATKKNKESLSIEKCEYEYKPSFLFHSKQHPYTNLKNVKYRMPPHTMLHSQGSITS